MPAWVILLSLLAACSFKPGTTGDAGVATDGDAPDDTDRGSPLSSRGLLARYFINEAATGTTPRLVLDSAPNPLDMLITYTGELAYTELPTGRGLHWSSSSCLDRASIPVASTKLATLQGATAWSYELVVDVMNQDSESRIMTVNDGVNGHGSASVLTGNTNDLRLYAGAEFTTWAGNVNVNGRKVIHIVVNTIIDDRATLHINGVPVARTTSDFTQGSTLAFGQSDYFTLGNVEGSARSFIGDIYYAAVYNVALTEAEITSNNAVLATRDDP